MSTNKKTEIKDVNFEDAMKRLEVIASELAREGVKLEDALALYEEGVGLVRDCNKILENTERKIKMLQISATGEISETDFEDGKND